MATGLHSKNVSLKSSRGLQNGHSTGLMTTGAGEVLVALLVGCVGRHDDVHRRDAVALEEASPVALADVLADVDGERGPVDRAAADELHGPGGGRDLLAVVRVERAVRIPHEPPVIAAEEVPAVEQNDAVDPAKWSQYWPYDNS